MNAVDILVGVVIVLAALRGFFRGLLREVFGLLAIGVGIVAAAQWGAAASAALESTLPQPVLVRDALGFVGVFLIANVATNLVGLALDRLVSALLLGGVNRAAGALFGAAKATVVAAIALLFV